MRERLLGHDGATAVEYAIMIGLVALVIVAAVTVLGAAVTQKFVAVMPGFGGP